MSDSRPNDYKLQKPHLRDGTDRRIILDILFECLPHALPAPQIYEQLKVRAPHMTQLLFNEHLVWLKDREFIDLMPGRLGDESSDYHITRAGRAERRG